MWRYPDKGGGCGALINRWRPNCFPVLAGYFLVSEELLSFLVFGAGVFFSGSCMAGAQSCDFFAAKTVTILSLLSLRQKLVRAGPRVGQLVFVP